MAVFVNEPFTGSNGASITTLSGWTAHSTAPTENFTIQTNRVYASTTDPLFYNTAAPASADYSVEAQLYVASVPTSPTRVGLVGRVDTATATYYDFVYNSALGYWRIQRVNAGTGLVLVTYTQTLTPGATYTIKLEMVGSVLNGYVDGTLRLSVDDGVNALNFAGFAGIRQVGSVASTTTTGLHIDSLTATDASAPTSTGTYVGVGAASTTVGGASPVTVSPALPAGLAVDDYMIAVAFEKWGSGGFVTPTGWTQIHTFSGAATKLRAWGRFYQAGDTAPGIGITTNGLGGIAQVAAFRGLDQSTTVDVLGAGASGTGATNIGPITGLTPSVAKAVVVVVAGRTVDWTSVATLSGDSLTWAEIAEADSASAPQIGLVWDYAIFAGDPTAVTDKTFTVTGGTGSWNGYMLVFRPATTVAPPDTGGGTKVKIGGVFVTKVAKRKAAGVFATKPLKVISPSPPPPPPPPPTPYTLTAVVETDEAMPLTYTAAPPVYFVFPPQERDTASPLSYQFHPPPGNPGMKIMMWTGWDNVRSMDATRLSEWKALGIDGFIMAGPRLFGEGGSASTISTALTFAKDFANAHPEFKCIFGLTTANFNECWTPHHRWFDDAGWSNTTVPGYQQIAQAIQNSALAGLAIEGEGYPCHTGGLSHDGWEWGSFEQGATNYVEGSSTYTEAQVRAKAKARGQQLASAVTAITGPVDVYQYYLFLHGSLKELVVTRYGDSPQASLANYIAVDWHDGWTSNSQVTFRHMDAIYYKPPYASAYPNGSYDGAYAFDKACYDGDARLRKSNAFHSPFIWVGPGPKTRRGDVGAFDRQYTTSEVTLQLQKARQYAEGGEFALYDQNYTPSIYASLTSAMQAASV